MVFPGGLVVELDGVFGAVGVARGPVPPSGIPLSAGRPKKGPVTIGRSTSASTVKARIAMATTRISCFSIGVPEGSLIPYLWKEGVIRILSGHISTISPASRMDFGISLNRND
jgi:hypothetical protein